MSSIEPVIRSTRRVSGGGDENKRETPKKRERDETNHASVSKRKTGIEVLSSRAQGDEDEDEDEDEEEVIEEEEEDDEEELVVEEEGEEGKEGKEKDGGGGSEYAKKIELFKAEFEKTNLPGGPRKLAACIFLILFGGTRGKGSYIRALLLRVLRGEVEMDEPEWKMTMNWVSECSNEYSAHALAQHSSAKKRMDHAKRNFIDSMKSLEGRSDNEEELDRVTLLRLLVVYVGQAMMFMKDRTRGEFVHGSFRNQRDVVFLFGEREDMCDALDWILSRHVYSSMRMRWRKDEEEWINEKNVQKVVSNFCASVEKNNKPWWGCLESICNCTYSAVFPDK